MGLWLPDLRWVALRSPATPGSQVHESRVGAGRPSVGELDALPRAQVLLQNQLGPPAPGATRGERRQPVTTDNCTASCSHVCAVPSVVGGVSAPHIPRPRAWPAVPAVPLPREHAEVVNGSHTLIVMIIRPQAAPSKTMRLPHKRLWVTVTARSPPLPCTAPQHHSSRN